MKLAELKAGQGKVDVEVKVKSKAEARTFQKYGKDLSVVNAVVEDESGEMQMSLWNDDIHKINVGDTVKITNGYVSEFNGTKQLSAGKFGKLEVVGNGAGGHAHAAPAKSHAKPAASGAPAHKDAKKEAPKKKAEDEEEGDEAMDGDELDSDEDFEDKEF